MASDDAWRFRFYQMQNGQPGFTSEQHLFDLPLNSFTCTQTLQQTGTWTATVDMADPGVQRAMLGQPPLHLLEDRTAFYVDLNGGLVFGGMLTQASYDSTTFQTTLNGTDWWGYLNQERIISWNASYTGADQLFIAADLVNIAQGNASASGTGAQSPAVPSGYVVGGNVGIQLGIVPTEALAGSYVSGQAQTVAWAESSFKNIGSAVSDTLTGSVGADWTIDVAYIGGVPTKTFNLWYPRAGRTQQQQEYAGSAVVFDIGSTSGVSYTWASGQTQPANVMFGAGSGTGNVAIASVASNPNLITEGYPLLENSVSYTDVISQALLDQLTLANLYATQYPVSQPVIRYTMGKNSNQGLGSFAIGDDVRLVIPPDPYFPQGYDSSRGLLYENWWRVQQVVVTIQDDGLSYMDITLGLPPVIVGE